MHNGSKYSEREGSWPGECRKGFPRYLNIILMYQCLGPTLPSHCVRLHVSVISCDGEFVPPCSRVVGDSQAVNTVTCTQSRLSQISSTLILKPVREDSNKILMIFVTLFLTRRHPLQTRHPSSVWATFLEMFHSPSLSPR